MVIADNEKLFVSLNKHNLKRLAKVTTERVIEFIAFLVTMFQISLLRWKSQNLLRRLNCAGLAMQSTPRTTVQHHFVPNKEPKIDFADHKQILPTFLLLIKENDFLDCGCETISYEKIIAVNRPHP